MGEKAMRESFEKERAILARCEFLNCLMHVWSRENENAEICQKERISATSALVANMIPLVSDLGFSIWWMRVRFLEPTDRCGNHSFLVHGGAQEFFRGDPLGIREFDLGLEAQI